MTTGVRRHFSGSPFEPRIGFCRALAVGDRILVSGTAPIGPDGKTVGPGDPYAQAQRCLTIIREAIEALGGDITNVVRTRMFLTDSAVWPEVMQAHAEFFANVQPVATAVIVSGLLDDSWFVEIEAEAVVATASAT